MSCIDAVMESLLPFLPAAQVEEAARSCCSIAHYGDSEVRIGAGDQVTISEAIALYSHLCAAQRCTESRAPARYEDVVFDTKNDLFLADDFMPPSVMKSVDTDEPREWKKILQELSIRGQPTIVVLPDGTVVPFSRIHAGGLGKEGVAERIRKSMADLERSEPYWHFTVSRLLRSVLFELERRGRQELTKPMFTKEKARPLIEMGIVADAGQRLLVVKGQDEIREEMERQLAEVRKLARGWLDSKVTL
ncbi:hypothetical protein [Thermogymnomonas acidicola]|nr:hypothetical protein [Thermogymnomonas acidicola]